MSKPARAKASAKPAAPADTPVPATAASAAPADVPVASPATPGQGLHVAGPLRGRRRGGYDFGPVPVTIPLVDLDDAARAAIEGDPQLMSRVVDLVDDA